MNSYQLPWIVQFLTDIKVYPFLKKQTSLTTASDTSRDLTARYLIVAYGRHMVSGVFADIGSVNGLVPFRRQDIVRINDDLFLIGSPGIHLSQI